MTGCLTLHLQATTLFIMEGGFNFREKTFGQDSLLLFMLFFSQCNYSHFWENQSAVGICMKLMSQIFFFFK